MDPTKSMVPSHHHATCGSHGELEQRWRQHIGGSGGVDGQAPTAKAAFGRILREAAAIYPDPGYPSGCLTTSAATNVTL